MSYLAIIKYAAWFDTDGQDEATSASDTATYTLENDASSEFWDFWIGTHFSASQSAGNYVSPAHNISRVSTVANSDITWDLALQNSTVAIDTRLSTDSGSTYGSWQNASSGQTIPELTQGVDVSTARLQYRITLTATTQTSTDTAKASGSVTLNIQGYDTEETSGTFEAYPTITVTYSAAATACKIERSAGGTYVEITSASLSAGSVLEFNMANMTITKNSTTNYLVFMTSASEFWAWQPDIEHAPVITTDANATIVITHTPRWL